MLDTTTALNTDTITDPTAAPGAAPSTALVATTPWAATLQRGDVALFRFPCADGGQIKPRPCLVMEIARIGGETLIELAYGTTAQTSANRGYEVHIYRPIGMALAGLRRPTRFVGARRIIVSARNGGFDVSPGYRSPVIGRLDGRGLERMNAVRARIHAERDIAADRRQAERAERVEQAAQTAEPAKARPWRPEVSRSRVAALAAARVRAAQAAGRRVAP
jgi:hypothetical protein